MHQTRWAIPAMIPGAWLALAGPTAFPTQEAAAPIPNPTARDMSQLIFQCHRVNGS